MFANDRLAETAALVALLRRSRGGWSAIAEAVEDAGTARTLLDAARDGDQTSLFDTEHDIDLRRISEEIEQWELDGTRLVSVLDAEYPSNLRAVFDRPPLVFIHGNVTPSDARAVAIVGSRQASDDRLAQAATFATSLADAGFTIISGLAEGVDGAAHRAALSAGGRTVAVIGTGIRRSYPAAHAELQAQIAREGAVLSQFWPDQPPTRQTFPMRNAVISGLSLGTIVIEASERSGTRIQTRFALAHHRPVFLLRHLTIQAWASELAAQPGVYVVDAPGDVAAILDRSGGLDALVA